MLGTLFHEDGDETGVVPEDTEKFEGRSDKMEAPSYIFSYEEGALVNAADPEADTELPGAWIEPDKLDDWGIGWLVNWLYEFVWELFHASGVSI